MVVFFSTNSFDAFEIFHFYKIPINIISAPIIQQQIFLLNQFNLNINSLYPKVSDNYIKKMKKIGQTYEKQVDMAVSLLESIRRNIAEQIITKNISYLSQKMGLKKPDPSTQQYEDLKKYLTKISYPNTELAQFHRQANRLGKNVAQVSQDSLFKGVSFAQRVKLRQLKICQCCGYVKQQAPLDTCQQYLKQVDSIGISTFMLFLMIKNVIYLILIALIIFGVFALASNIQVANLSIDESEIKLYSNTIKISLGPKITEISKGLLKDARIFLACQVWLGFAFVLVLNLFYVLMVKIQDTQTQKIQQINKSAADYSVVLQGIPFSAKQSEIQRQISKIFQSLKSTSPENKYLEKAQKQAQKDQVKLAKINIGAPAQILSQINELFQKDLQHLTQIKITERQNYIKWIKQLFQHQKFVTPKQKRLEAQQQIQRSLVKLQTDYKSKLSSFENPSITKNYLPKDTLTDAFVTFQFKKDIYTFLDLMENSAIDKFLKYLTLSIYKKTFLMKFGDKFYNVQIKKASQPQDIVWENIGTKTSELALRKFFTFLATFILLGVSFIIVYVLTTIKYHRSDDKLISILISISLIAFNFLISYCLQVFTYFEYNATQTHYQCSYAVKAVFAQLINMILIPVLVNLFLKKQTYFYEDNGLADDIFMLSLTSSFITPLLRIFNPFQVYAICYKKCYFNDPEQRFNYTQKNFNKIYEPYQFDSGSQYIFVLALYLFTCFFMPLQPIVIMFALAGMIFNYWTLKYYLFKKCKKPVSGTKIEYNTLVQFVHTGGLFYSIGNLLFVNIIPERLYNNNIAQTLFPNLLTIIASSLSLFIPYSFIYSQCSSKTLKTNNQTYSQDRFLFVTEYDRMNPYTFQKGLSQYKSLIQNIISLVSPEDNDNQCKKNDQMLRFTKAFVKQVSNINIRQTYQQKNPLNLWNFKNLRATNIRPRNFNVLGSDPFNPQQNEIVQASKNILLQTGHWLKNYHKKKQSHQLKQKYDSDMNIKQEQSANCFQKDGITSDNQVRPRSFYLNQSFVDIDLDQQEIKKQSKSQTLKKFDELNDQVGPFQIVLKMTSPVPEPKFFQSEYPDNY